MIPKNYFYSRVILALLLSIFITEGQARPLHLDAKGLNSPPPRIIRPCCSFGTEVKMAGIPVKITNITSVEYIGQHKYLGHKSEKNGIVYTKKGGFIDLGHLRDQADWTAYLYGLILNKKENNYIQQKLGYEGGQKLLEIFHAPELDSTDAIFLAGRIAYDLSVWHEIATWFGTSYLPFVPERYSSFSVEDAYSNLLGVYLGMEALKSDLPYEEAMTYLLKNKLIELEVVEGEAETYAAMEEVEGIWWTREKRLPSRKVLLQRFLGMDACLSPWVLKESLSDAGPGMVCIRKETNKGKDLNYFYALNFKLNQKFPFKKMFPERKERKITNIDFPVVMQWVTDEIQQDSFAIHEKRDKKSAKQRNKKYKKIKPLKP